MMTVKKYEEVHQRHTIFEILFDLLVFFFCSFGHFLMSGLCVVKKPTSKYQKCWKPVRDNKNTEKPKLDSFIWMLAAARWYWWHGHMEMDRLNSILTCSLIYLYFFSPFHSFLAFLNSHLPSYFKCRYQHTYLLTCNALTHSLVVAVIGSQYW